MIKVNGKYFVTFSEVYRKNPPDPYGNFVRLKPDDFTLDVGRFLNDLLIVVDIHEWIASRNVWQMCGDARIVQVLDQLFPRNFRTFFGVTYYGISSSVFTLMKTNSGLWVHKFSSIESYKLNVLGNLNEKAEDSPSPI